jgi:hypothetical protein
MNSWSCLAAGMQKGFDLHFTAGLIHPRGGAASKKFPEKAKKMSLE